MPFLIELKTRWRKITFLSLVGLLPSGIRWAAEQWTGDKVAALINSVGPWLWGWMAGHPLGSGVASTCFVVGLFSIETKFHEYKERRFSRAAGNELNDTSELSEPQGIFQVLSMRADYPSSDESIHFKNKIRMNLKNVTGKSIYVWLPLWESSLVQAQDSPPGSRMLVEREKGSWNVNLSQGKWVTQKGKDGPVNCEFCYILLKPEMTFNCYVGLAPPSAENVEGMLKRYGTIGTVIFPVRIDGTLHEVRVSAREV